jgi:signal transduction histidine kinase
LSNAGGLSRALDEARARNASLEAQLAEAWRLASLASLTRGVAHDFGNVLAAIAGYNDLMLRSLAPDSQLRRGAESIQHAVASGQRLVRQLLTPGRAPVDGPSADLNAVVADVVRTLRPLLGERTTVELRLDPAAGAVAAGPAAIEQVTMNLVLNARDAMPSGGCVTVLTGRKTPDAPTATLSVQDTGVGMDAPTRARVFELFFTTKAPGHGMGVGLATVDEIVRQHGGRVEVSSEPGRGSTFRVSLPAAGPAATDGPPAGARSAGARRRGRRRRPGSRSAGGRPGGDDY